MYDGFHRKIEYVRISVTDQCNLRCRYCMPETGAPKMQHEDILSYEEILRIIRGLAALGVRKVRFTGGEPLARAGIIEMIAEAKRIPGIEYIAITTNGVLLPKMAAELKSAGIDGVNVSLDTLNGDTFSYLTRRNCLEEVHKGFAALEEIGIRNVKLNCVPIAGVNESDILLLAELARERPVKVRFIELMPIGCAREEGLRGMPMEEVHRRMRNAFGPMKKVLPGSSLQGPAEYVRPEGFQGQIGFIEALSHKFCSTCNRVRITSAGFLKLCLHHSAGVDLRGLLRRGITDIELQNILLRAIYDKPKEHFFSDLEYRGRDSHYMYQVGG